MHDTLPLPTLFSKVTPPCMRGVFPRKRLFGLMDDIRDHPALWVQAPGGSGKSTLVASHLDSHGVPHIWYQVDGGDADIASFFHYLGGAAVKADRRKIKRLPAWSPAQMLSLPVFARRYFSALFSFLPPSAAIVFDNYQDLPANVPLHEVVREAIGVIPPDARIIVISREGPPATFARLQANGVIGLMGWEELRLDLDEARELVRMKGGPELSDEGLGYLHDKTEGWAAGIVLLVEHLKRTGRGLGMLERVDPAGVFDYFAAEIFDLADREMQEFLLKTAFLNRITVPIAEKLTGNGRAQQLLSGLARSNYFTTRHQGREASYQYHQLFQEFLRARAHDLLMPAELQALRRGTAALLEDAGLIEDAGIIYAELEDWDSLSAMALHQAPGLVAEGRTRLVEEWLTCLPPHVTDGNPWILFWLGACRLSRGFAEARACFEKAFSLFKSRREPAGLYLAWSGIVDSIVYEWADFSRLDVWIEQLNRLMRLYPSFPSAEIEARVAGSMFGALMFHLPQHPEIDGWAERILALTKGSSDPAHRIMVGNQLALYHLWWTGNHTKLGMVMDLLRPPNRGEGFPPLARIIWISLQGLQAWASGLSADAQRAFEEGQRIAGETGVHVWDFMLYFQGIVSYLGEGDYRTGGKYLEELFAGLDRTQHLNVAHCCYVAAWQAVLAGETGRAREHVRNAIEVTEHLGGPFTHATVRAAWAQVQYLSGSHDEALGAIEESIESARDIKAPLLIYRNLMVKAFFALDSGREEDCLETLREALALGRERRYMNFSWWMKSVMTRLCLKALEAGIEVDYVRELISRRSLLPEEPPLQIGNWPWPLKVYMLGRFVLEKESVPLEFVGKVQKKPLELLKALVALGGMEAHEGQIADLLWPDADGDTARSSLKTTLHRLRQLIGCEEAVAVREGRLCLDRRHVWTDVQAFEQFIREAQLKAEAGDEAGAVRLTEEALALYCGRFLAGDDRPWLTPLRERLASRFILTVAALGNLRVEQGEFKQALSRYEKGLEVDDLSEQLYQGLMHCYLAAGLRSEAIATFLRCKKVLASSLGIEPSTGTMAVYAQALTTK